jgi:hypothetical protein
MIKEEEKKNEEKEDEKETKSKEGKKNRKEEKGSRPRGNNTSKCSFAQLVYCVQTAVAAAVAVAAATVAGTDSRRPPKVNFSSAAEQGQSSRKWSVRKHLFTNYRGQVFTMTASGLLHDGDAQRCML